jgi:hypothetical protein
VNVIRRLSIWQRIWAVVAICGLIYAFRSPVLSCIEARPGECGSDELEELGVSLLVWLLSVALLYAVGAAGAWFARGRAILLYGAGALAAVWFAALAIESVTRLMAAGFSRAGAGLPGMLLLFVSAVQSYVPWIMALVSTLIIVYLWRRPSDYFLQASTVVAVVAVALVVAAFGLMYETGVSILRESYELAVRAHRQVAPLREFNIVDTIGAPLLLWLVFVVVLFLIAAIAASINRGRAIPLYGLGVVVAVWFVALAIELVTPLMRAIYASFGADLPGPTLLTIYAVQSGVPRIVAVISTLVIGGLWAKANRNVMHVCAAVAALAAASAAYAAISFVLPTSQCGVLWPEWPASLVGSPPSSQGAPNLALGTDTPRRAPAGECR